MVDKNDAHTEQVIQRNMVKILQYQQLPFYKQKSPEWLNQRNNYLTASTIASVLGLMGPEARYQLLLNKASNGQISSFNGNEATYWGQKYEPVANRIYSYRNNGIKIYEFGMITNDKYPILGVSPDGITQYRLLEIKCPYSREINGVIKTEYFHQMQEQMVVCDFDQCDFLECQFKEVTSNQFWDDFDQCENGNQEKGIIIAYLDTETVEIGHIYSPIEYHLNRDKMKEWEQETIQKLIRTDSKQIYITHYYWYLCKYNCQLVNRDPQWITQNYPILEKFWNEVLYYREHGVQLLIDKHDKEKNSIPITKYLKIQTQPFPKIGKCLL